MSKRKEESIQSVTDLLQLAGSMAGGTVAVAGGDRVEDLKLVEAARDHGIIDRIVLVGPERRMVEALDGCDIAVDPEDIIQADGPTAIAERVVSLIRDGQVDMVLKGNISTPIINRHMLALAERPTVSLASLFDAAPIADGRPMILTDPGVTTQVTEDRLLGLIDNAVHVAQVVLGLERPRVALLSANEKQIPSLASTVMALAMAKRPWAEAFVCGPLSFDLATDPESAALKGMPDLPHAGEVVGRADILVCPGIDAANILYKAIMAMARYGQASIAGVTVGFPVPYIILSRADTLEIKLLSIALSRIYSVRMARRRQKK